MLSSSRDNWERLVKAVIKRDEIGQLCRQNSISTITSDTPRSSYSSEDILGIPTVNLFLAISKTNQLQWGIWRYAFASTAARIDSLRFDFGEDEWERARIWWREIDELNVVADNAIFWNGIWK
ncbi:hypothetical protein SASPL_150213 [Salvia splendens]|uniref:Uncharacterized protein n=1 Tax=Salvia splendens TaxID=180675 RepID=A0A8X8W5Q3_SALSN|nr:hypothetical protein SASPL_150213 [Salvia splendens]